MARYRIDDTENIQVDSWIPINLTDASEDSTKPARVAAERALAEILECEHVVVLAGLGTSLCIKNATGECVFPTMNRLWTRVRDEVGDESFGQVQRDVGTSDRNIEELLSRCLMKLALEPKASEAEDATNSSLPGRRLANFVKVAEAVIRTETRKLLAADATATHEDFLRRLARRSARQPRPNLFTTNYDLCFETAAARISLPIIDGFSFSMPPQFQPEIFDYDIVTSSSYAKEPDLVPRLLRLFKLHGSVDWHLDDGFITKRPETESPLLIYPQAGKYAASYSPPFLEVMARFQGLLRQRNVGLLAICCGFNDLHIAQPVLSAIKANSGLRALICAPDLSEHDAIKMEVKPASTTNPTLRQLDRLIETGDTRLTFINGFLPDLVKLMPLLPMQTAAEQHEWRLKKLEQEMAALREKSKVTT